MKKSFLALIFSLAASVSLVAQDRPKPDSADAAPALTAVPAEPSANEKADAEKHGDLEMETPALAAVLTPTKGNETRGVVTFEPLKDEQVRITARVSGLKPDSKHAIHIHEFGDVSSGDGTSAGGHFNPAGKAHGLPDSEERHVGDFGNLKADADGNANLVLTVEGLSLTEGNHAVIGRAVIVHAGEDKGTQPTGDAGDRVAQGVIAIANPASMKSGVAERSEDVNESTVSAAEKPGQTASVANRPVATPSETTAEKVSRGTEKAVRDTARVVERGAEEVGDAFKKVGRKIEDAVE
jgi:Cu-Zn family superoxide dismutase